MSDFVAQSSSASSLPVSPASSRPTSAHAAAAIINAVASVCTVVSALPVLDGGADKSTQVPWVEVVVAFVLGILGLVGSYGVWRRQRWGVVFTIVINVISFITGAPGILFGGTAFLVIGSIVLCLANVAVVYLLLRRRSAAANRR